MSTFVVEPGTRLAGRYHLLERVSEVSGCTLWKAVDEPLARPVAVRTFRDDFPRVREVVLAARAASRVTDSRLAQVFDADDMLEHPYVVSEWIAGDRLVDLLANGPLEPERAAALIGDAAEALAAAHTADLAHLRLRPSCLLWTKGGTIKITGLGVDAAVRDVAVTEDPEVVDARGLGALLYAALTAHWPGPETSALPPAPRSDGHPCSTRQVRAGVPTMLDAIVERALRQQTPRGLPPLTSPAAVAEALAEIPRPAPLPPPAAAPASPDDSASPTLSVQPAVPSYIPAPARGGSSVGRTLMLSLVVVLFMAAIGLGGWQLGRVFGDRAGSPGPSAASSRPGAPTHASALPVSGVTAYDPMGDNQEHNDEASNATDDDPQTVWKTDSYNSAALGNLKPGVGLMLDMGKAVSVRNVGLDMVGQGASLELHVGDQPDISAMPEAASVSGAGQHVELRPDKPVKGRYLLLWVTELPQTSEGYRAEVTNVVVRGT